MKITKNKKLREELFGNFAYKPRFLDEYIGRALRRRMKVTIFLCKDKEGGIGVKIDGKELIRNLPWETFEFDIDEED